jgi:CHAT domain-containing protein
MDEATEDMRREAERLSDVERVADLDHSTTILADWRAKAVNAWLEVAVRVHDENGAGDHRAFAADSRRARLLLLSGANHRDAENEAALAAFAFGADFGEDSAEALYARETVALCRLSQGDATGARALLSALLDGASGAFGEQHPQTASIRSAFALAEAAAEGKAQGFTLAGGPGDRLYRPIWEFAPMSETAEGFRLAAEGVSDEAPENAAAAWSAVADFVESVYGASDLRALAARSRRERQSLLSGGDPEEVATRAKESADWLAEALSEFSAEALYALETAALAKLAGDRTWSADSDLASVFTASAWGLGWEHPQTLAATRSLTLAGGLESVVTGLEFLSMEQAVALGPEHPERLVTELALAEARLKFGDRAGARETLTGLIGPLERWLSPSSRDVLTARLALAVLLAEDGRLFEARGLLYRQVEELTRLKGEDDLETLDALERLSGVQAELGEFADARDGMRRVTEGRERASGGTGHDVIRAFRTLARLQALAGDSDAELEARLRLVEALDWNYGANSPEVLGALVEARDALEAAVAGYGPEHPQVSGAASRLGSVLMDAGEAAQAVFYLKTALDVAWKARPGLARLSPDERGAWIAAVRNGHHELFAALLAAGRPEEALVALRLLKENELGEMDPDPESRRVPPEGALNLESNAWSDGGSHAGGIPTGPENGIPTGPEGGTTSGTEGGIPAGTEGGIPAGTEGGIPSGQEVLSPAGSESDLFEGTPDLKARHAYLEVADSDARAGMERARLAERLASEGTLSEDDRIRLDELTARAGEARKAFLDFCDSLPGLLREGAGVPAAAAARNLAARQATLAEMGAGAVLIHAVSSEDALHLVLVTPHAITVKESPAGQVLLAELATEFRGLLTDPASDPRPAGKSLYDAVIAPLEAELAGAGAETHMLSLDGPLRYVPLAALWDGEMWLAERWPTALFTESSVDKLRTPPPEGDVRARALGVTRGWPGFPALTGVAEETAAVVAVASDGGGEVAGEGSGSGVDAECGDSGGTEGPGIGSAVPGGGSRGTGNRSPGPGDEASGGDGRGVLQGERLLDGDFTRGALSASLASHVPVVHIASHFKLDPASHERTVLLLGDGTLLSLNDMERAGDLDFTAVDLLTLSACDTAVGVLRGNGREVESFGEVVQRAGASAVLATLWPVADGPTAELMREFYRLRYLEGMDKARALRGAQLWVMRGSERTGGTMRGTAISAAGVASVSGTGAGTSWGGIGYSHPYYWAPFVVMGNWR